VKYFRFMSHAASKHAFNTAQYLINGHYNDIKIVKDGLYSTIKGPNFISMHLTVYIVSHHLNDVLIYTSLNL
jgi:hypothetical protein